MTDIRADELNEDDRLPWLEAVEEEEESNGPSALKLIAAVVIGLLTIGLIVGGLFWLGNRGESGDPQAELIRAPEGAYKVEPDSPGGMAVEGEGDSAYAASEGADPRGSLNMNVAEAPVAQRPQPGQQPAPTAQPAQPAPPGSTIQLGAFSTQAGATNAWQALSRRFTYLAPLTHSIVPAQVGGRTLYRLRVSGPDAAGICRRLQVAGESCTPAN
jgi:hypothetical protein